MSDIFISYASEDRHRAQELAGALGMRGWSVWWDRKIPLGKSFDEVIEKALGESKCVIVLWSALSAASEWVRNEASEAKRRGILVPVFLEAVDAPLAFRLLNGANLSDWQASGAHPEFDKLVERVAELLGRPESTADSIGGTHGAALRRGSDQPNRVNGFSRLVGWLVVALLQPWSSRQFLSSEMAVNRRPRHRKFLFNPELPAHSRRLVSMYPNWKRHCRD